MITPSFASNRAYFGKYVDEKDVYEPTKDSIDQVIAEVEKDRDEWEQFQEKIKMHKQFMQSIEKNVLLNDYQLLFYDSVMDKPKYKYN